MSKEIHVGALGVPDISMAAAMARANTVGIVIVSSWAIIIVAHVTGNLHPLAGAVAVASAFMSVCLLAYNTVMRQVKKREVVMMGFGLYVTAPIFVCSTIAYYLSSGWVVRH